MKNGNICSIKKILYLQFNSFITFVMACPMQIAIMFLIFQLDKKIHLRASSINTRIECKIFLHIISQSS